MVRVVLALTLVLCATALAQAPPLSVTITKPRSGERIGIEGLGPRNTYPVSGRLSGGSEPFRVTVNGARASVSPGPRFSRDTPLRRGRNTITVEATDSTGATATRTVTVTVVAPSQPSPPAAGPNPNRWPAKPVTRKACASPRVGFGRIRQLRVARISCARAGRIVRATQRDRGRACTPNPADGRFSRCRASGFSCYSRFRGSTTIQYACVRGRRAARWYQVS